MLRQESLLLSKASRPGLGTQQRIQWVPRELSTDVKRPGDEVGHSHPSCTEVNNTRSDISTHNMWRFNKHSSNFAYTFTSQGILPSSFIIPKLL
jgi:hypothetical protein